MTLEQLKQSAMADFSRRCKQMRQAVEAEDSRHDPEIRDYIRKAVNDIARKCQTSESEVWAEMEYWSRDKA